MWPHHPIHLTLIMLLLSIVYRTRSDCSGDDVLIKDGSSRLSPNGTFELGFFTPDGSSSKTRYFGIWYHQSNPKVVVWVAIGDKLLLESNGCFVVRDGNAMVLNAEGIVFWSTNFSLRGSIIDHPSNVSYDLQFTDDGNLFFNNRIGFAWQSFDHPTDTFLIPGMSSFGNPNLLLTSWQGRHNPAPGNFTFQRSLLAVYNGKSVYWRNSSTPFDSMPAGLSELLTGKTSHLEDNSTARLVMNYTGQLQLWKWQSNGGWHLDWSVPRDGFCLENVCGDFGSCNSGNGRLCKCLPGFTPNKPDKWRSGNFSEGCFPKSQSCTRPSTADDRFLRLPMMKLGQWNSDESTSSQDCPKACQNDCHCVAYSCGRADCNDETGSPTHVGCLRWTSSTDLVNIQEEYPEGYTIFVRTTSADIALTSRDCDPCGTNLVPYPLSTAPNCGDASYKYFHCNESNGQLEFSISKPAFKVIATSNETKTFTIQIRGASNCDKMRRNIESLIKSPKPSLPFKVTNCSVVNQSFAEVQHLFTEVELYWHPAPEPICNTSLSCSDWAHTTCKPSGGGEMRCICESKFKWDGSILKCREKPKFPVKVVVSCIAAALAAVLCGIFFIHYVQKRRKAEMLGAIEFQGDDSGAIDVPFFDWGSILAATTNFADENKLGTGGFGAVYKGKLPDGKEIAVKRLSSVSEQGIEEFRTEVVLIAKLQHRNLVRLLGYCMKAHERILVYEYMPNGSLDSCLFDQTRSMFLDWGKRFDIIFGIARGLLYLHEDSRLRIIHRDLKPSNILLDEELNPKISDFGIARIVGGKDTEGSTKRVVGTYGYMSPEYAYEGIFSVKSDVFSFGIVVLETISGRRNSKVFQIEHGLNLQGYAWKLWNEDRGLDLVDQTLKESCKQSQALKCIHIGLLCVQEDPGDRPTMSAVVWMFGAENASLPNPKQPAFISKKEPSETASSSSLIDSSSNNVIIISMEGR